MVLVRKSWQPQQALRLCISFDFVYEIAVARDFGSPRAISYFTGRK